MAIVSTGLTASVAAQPRPENRPIRVVVRDLVSEPDRYDGHYVTVSGIVRSMALQRGRMGGHFIELTLDDIVPDADQTASITVVSLTFPHVRTGNYVNVRSVYHREGRQGGHPYEFFIDAEEISRHGVV